LKAFLGFPRRAAKENRPLRQPGYLVRTETRGFADRPRGAGCLFGGPFNTGFARAGSSLDLWPAQSGTPEPPQPFDRQGSPVPAAKLIDSLPEVNKPWPAF